MIEAKFKSMNSTIYLYGLSPKLQSQIKNSFYEFEQKASRFIPENDLDYLNKSPLHVPVHVEETLADLLEKSLTLSRKANYYVNPFMGDVMKSIGYSHSFDEGFKPSFPIKHPNWEGNKEEPMERISKQWLIKRSPFSFDFGGFGKGYIVDQTRKFLQDKVTNAFVNAGGDLMAIGTHQLGIEHPTLEGKDMMRFYVKDKSLATSGKSYRKWSKNGEKVHHLVNGKTYQVAENGVLQASVLAKTTMEAETVSKIFCILPFEQAKALVFNRFPAIAYFVYFENGQLVAGGDSSLFEGLEVAQ